MRNDELSVNPTNVVQITKMLLKHNIDDIATPFLEDANYFIDELLFAWQEFSQPITNKDNQYLPQDFDDKMAKLISAVKLLLNILTPYAKQQLLNELQEIYLQPPTEIAA
jgi:hypothetical protein